MIEELVKEGWAYHDSEPERLAKELEAEADAPLKDHLAPFLNLSNHTIGDHLGDWVRAKRLAESCMANVELTAANFRAAVFLSVSRFMCGDTLGAYEAELLAMKALPEDPVHPILDSRMLAARSLVLKGQAHEALILYNAAVNVADQRLKEGKAHRSLAATSNNLASDLLDKSQRTVEEETLMLVSAARSLSFWRACGTWENEERALYLIVLISNATGKFEDAIEQARKSLAIIKDNGGEPVDEAFVRLAMANAYRLLEEHEKFQAELGRADKLAASWNDESLFSWYTDTRKDVCPTRSVM